jgi:hypothetical protein
VQKQGSSGFRKGTFSNIDGWVFGQPTAGNTTAKEQVMHGIIYLIGLIVVIMAVLSFFGLR